MALALSLASVVSTVGFMSSVNGVASAAKGIVLALDNIECSHELSQLLLLQCRTSAAIISQPAHCEYLQDDYIAQQANEVIRSIKRACEWVLRYRSYTWVKRYLKADIYASRFNAYIKEVEIHTSGFMHLCVAHSLRTPSKCSAGSDNSEGGRLGIDVIGGGGGVHIGEQSPVHVISLNDSV